MNGLIAYFDCAYCGTTNETVVDQSAGAKQSYTEDCQICCRPNILRVVIDPETEDVLIDSEFEG